VLNDPGVQEPFRPELVETRLRRVRRARRAAGDPFGMEVGNIIGDES